MHDHRIMTRKRPVSKSSEQDEPIVPCRGNVVHGFRNVTSTSTDDSDGGTNLYCTESVLVSETSVALAEACCERIAGERERQGWNWVAQTGLVAAKELSF